MEPVLFLEFLGFITPFAVGRNWTIKKKMQEALEHGTCFLMLVFLPAVLVVLSDLFVGFVAYHQCVLRLAMIALNGLFCVIFRRTFFFVVSLPNNFKIKNCENFCFDSLH